MQQLNESEFWLLLHSSSKTEHIMFGQKCPSLLVHTTHYILNRHCAYTLVWADFNPIMIWALMLLSLLMFFLWFLEPSLQQTESSRR